MAQEGRCALSTWVDQAIYEKVRQQAYDEQVNVSQFLRVIVEQAMQNVTLKPVQPSTFTSQKKKKNTT